MSLTTWNCTAGRPPLPPERGQPAH